MDRSRNKFLRISVYVIINILDKIVLKDKSPQNWIKGKAIFNPYIM